MTAFNKEQTDLLIGYVNDMKSTFDAQSKQLGDSFVSLNIENMERMDGEIRRLSTHGDKLNQAYELYVNRVVAELKANDADVKVRHEVYVKELRIASIATIYASGRGLETSNSIIKQIEELVNNPE